jgi:hypothetical protein
VPDVEQRRAAKGELPVEDRRNAPGAVLLTDENVAIAEVVVNETVILIDNAQFRGVRPDEVVQTID